MINLCLQPNVRICGLIVTISRNVPKIPHSGGSAPNCAVVAVSVCYAASHRQLSLWRGFGCLLGRSFWKSSVWLLASHHHRVCWYCIEILLVRVTCGCCRWCCRQGLHCIGWVISINEQHASILPRCPDHSLYWLVFIVKWRMVMTTIIVCCITACKVACENCGVVANKTCLCSCVDGYMGPFCLREFYFIIILFYISLFWKKILKFLTSVRGWKALVPPLNDNGILFWQGKYSKMIPTKLEKPDGGNEKVEGR